MTVWCAEDSHGITSSIFVNVTVTTERYVNVVKNDFILIFQCNPGFEKMWFMRDRTSPHRTQKGFSQRPFKWDSIFRIWINVTTLLTTLQWSYIEDKTYQYDIIPKPLLSWKLPFRKSSAALVFRYIQWILQIFVIHIQPTIKALPNLS